MDEYPDVNIEELDVDYLMRLYFDLFARRLILKNGIKAGAFKDPDLKIKIPKKNPRFR